MQLMSRLPLIFMFAIGLVGCVTAPVAPIQQQEFEGMADISASSDFRPDATVYVFRDPNIAGKFVNLSVQLDRITQVELSRHSYAKLRVPAGRHELAFVWPSGGVLNMGECMNFLPDATYYITYMPSVGSIENKPTGYGSEMTITFQGEVSSVTKNAVSARFAKYKSIPVLANLPAATEAPCR